MPSELDELVEFLHHGNSQIRQIACENLVEYSVAEPAIFKRHQLLPVKDLKLLVRDYTSIAKNAITILINLSSDSEVVENLAGDDSFIETILKRITHAKEPFRNELCMLLANISKSPSLDRLIKLARSTPTGTPQDLLSSNAMDQLMDCFVMKIPTQAGQDCDYLSYVFADLSRYDIGREYFLKQQDYDGVVPINKLTVFTDEKVSHVRRKGVASTLKNLSFETGAHDFLFSESGANILAYLLLPLASGSDELSDEDTDEMLPDLQLLPPDKQRDSDPEILLTHLETLLLLTTDRPGRDIMRKIQVYPLIRECHLHVENEEVRDACDRLVQILMRSEAGDGSQIVDSKAGEDQMAPRRDVGKRHEKKMEEDKDDKIVEIF